MKRITVTTLLFLCAIAATSARADGKTDWKAKMTACLTGEGGLTAAQAAQAESALETCRNTAKTAGREKFRETMQTCMTSPANAPFDAAFKKCHHGGGPHGDKKG